MGQRKNTKAALAAAALDTVANLTGKRRGRASSIRQMITERLEGRTLLGAATSTNISTDHPGPSGSVYSTSVTFEADVTALANGDLGATAPTGSVEFFDTTTSTDLGAGTYQAGLSVDPVSAWTLSTPSLNVTAGDHINAFYTPASDGNPLIASDTTASPVTQIVTKANSAVTAGPTDAGGTYTTSPIGVTAATATSAQDAGLNDSNLAHFTLSYSGTGLTSYVASSTAPTHPGTYQVTAQYNGDANHFASAVSAATPFTITKATPTIQTNPTAGTVTYANTLASSSLTGGVVWDPTTLSPIVGGGSFAWTTPATIPTVGGPSQSVTFTPTDTVDYTSTATALVPVTVIKATPTVAILGNPDTVGVGSTYSISATVTGVSGIPGTSLDSPSVPVTLTYYVGVGTGGTNLGSTPPTTIEANAGTYTVVASFAGSTNYNAASTAITFVISSKRAAIHVTPNTPGTHGPTRPLAPKAVTPIA